MGETSGQSKDRNLPWVEKYRPQKVADVLGDEDTKIMLPFLEAKGDLPNLIFSGPPGSGKTTSILALAHGLLGSHFKDAVLELNASDYRDIDVVKSKITMFAEKKVTLPFGRHKIVVVDEADSMAPRAQQALRTIMEMYSQTTRFVLTCYVPSKIIPAIQSHFSIVRFYRLTDQQIFNRLLYVVVEEKVPYVREGLEAIVSTADGDMRQALNNLQATFSGFQFINKENVFKAATEFQKSRSCKPVVVDNFYGASSSVRKRRFSPLKLSSSVDKYSLSPSITCKDSLRELLTSSTVDYCNRIVGGFNIYDCALIVEILSPHELHIALGLSQLPPGLQQGVDPQVSTENFRVWLIQAALLVPGVTDANRVGDQLSLGWHNLSAEQVNLIAYDCWMYIPWVALIETHMRQPFCQVLEMIGTKKAGAHLHVLTKVFGL